MGPTSPHRRVGGPGEAGRRIIAVQAEQEASDGLLEVTVALRVEEETAVDLLLDVTIHVFHVEHTVPGVEVRFVTPIHDSDRCVEEMMVSVGILMEVVAGGLAARPSWSSRSIKGLCAVCPEMGGVLEGRSSWDRQRRKIPAVTLGEASGGPWGGRKRVWVVGAVGSRAEGCARADRMTTGVRTGVGRMVLLGPGVGARIPRKACGSPWEARGPEGSAAWILMVIGACGGQRGAALVPRGSPGGGRERRRSGVMLLLLSLLLGMQTDSEITARLPHPVFVTP